jgi:hypothetical protein
MYETFLQLHVRIDGDENVLNEYSGTEQVAVGVPLLVAGSIYLYSV